MFLVAVVEVALVGFQANIYAVRVAFLCLASDIGGPNRAFLAAA
jgi:hypothetical protein